MAILIRVHVSKSNASRARRLPRLLVSAALAIVVVAPAVSWASLDQEVQTITRLADGCEQRRSQGAARGAESAGLPWTGGPGAAQPAGRRSRARHPQRRHRCDRRHLRGAAATRARLQRRRRIRMDPLSDHAMGGAARTAHQPRARACRRLAVGAPRCRLRAGCGDDATDRRPRGRRVDLLARGPGQLGAARGRHGRSDGCAPPGPGTI